MFTDLGIALPSSWRRTSAPDRGVLVSARAATVPASGLRPELLLRCSPVAASLAEWRRQELRDLAARLHDFVVEDEDEIAYRRFAHRLGPVDVMCDQWAWRDERAVTGLVAGQVTGQVTGPVTGLGVTLTGSVAREDYWDYCGVFQAVAETVDIGPRAA
jgi:hypothetical protein